MRHRRRDLSTRTACPVGERLRRGAGLLVEHLDLALQHHHVGMAGLRSIHAELRPEVHHLGLSGFNAESFGRRPDLSGDLAMMNAEAHRVDELGLGWPDKGQRDARVNPDVDRAGLQLERFFSQTVARGRHPGILGPDGFRDTGEARDSHLGRHRLFSRYCYRDQRYCNQDAGRHGSACEPFPSGKLLTRRRCRTC